MVFGAVLFCQSFYRMVEKCSHLLPDIKLMFAGMVHFLRLRNILV
jgi:hypothetical protein